MRKCFLIVNYIHPFLLLSLIIYFCLCFSKISLSFRFSSKMSFLTESRLPAAFFLAPLVEDAALGFGEALRALKECFRAGEEMVVDDTEKSSSAIEGDPFFALFKIIAEYGASG